VFAHHGVLEAERRDGQTFVIDVDIVCRPFAAAPTDDLADTVDYAAVADRVVELGQGGPYDLIETLADLIAGALVREFPVESARVRVAKPDAPIPHPFEEVAVTVTRSA
jgi:dihydroneopterin aldolase